jgi:ferredoxin, 2Fe-2S
MTKVTFVTQAGEEMPVNAQDGRSLMEAAVMNGVPGIVATCGGVCSCATCHVHIDESWVDRLDPAVGMEEIMLEFAENVGPTSRLSCQIKMKPALEGLVVRVGDNLG